MQNTLSKESLNSLLDTLVTYTKVYSRPFSKESLIHDLPIEKGQENPELFSINNSKSLFSRAAKNAGLKTKFVKKSIDSISVLQLPIILMMNNNTSCIVDSFSDDYSKIKIIEQIDDEIVEQWFDTKKIEDNYLGFAVLVKKSFNIFHTKKEETRPYNIQHWFWDTLKISKKIYIEVIFASLLVNLFVLATPLFTMNVYDRVIPNNAVETLWFFAGGIIIVYALDIFLKLTRSYFLEIAAKKSDVIISSLIFEKVLGLKLEQIPKPIGSFANNLKNFDVIRSFLTNATLVAFIDLPFAIIFLLVIYYIGGPLMVLIPLTVIILILAMSFGLKYPIQTNIKAINELVSKKNAILIEVLNNIETLKSLGGTNNIRWNWEESNGKIAKVGLKSRMFSSFIPSFTSFLIQLNTIGIVILGVYLIKDFELTMGGLIAVVILSSRAVAPMGQAAGLITNYEDAANAYKILNDLMHKEDERPKANNFVTRDEFAGKIEFRNVTFIYPGTDVEVLKDVSFIINPGEHVAILGKIGSGKSSIIKLILKLYEPTSGSILIDDIDISQLDPADIRRNMGYVSQHVSLLNGTLKDNITHRASYVNDDMMLKAAQIACVDNFANSHPRGYDMVIGENGEGLSGGQIQSVGIARACLFDYKINLMDEPTSSMDRQTEVKIIRNLKNHMKNKSLILITQKMNVLSMVDKIIVIADKTVYLQGNKDAVMKALSSGDSNEQK